LFHNPTKAALLAAFIIQPIFRLRRQSINYIHESLVGPAHHLAGNYRKRVSSNRTIWNPIRRCL